MDLHSQQTRSLCG